MLLRPCLAVSALIFSDHHNCHVGALRGVNCFFDFVGLRFWIYEFNVVVEPAVPVLMLVGETAALGEDNLGFVADAILNSLKNSHAMRRPPAVSAEVQSIGIRADYRDRLHLAQIE